MNVERDIEKSTGLLGIDSLKDEQKFAANTFMQGKPGLQLHKQPLESPVFCIRSQKRTEGLVVGVHRKPVPI